MNKFQIQLKPRTTSTVAKDSSLLLSFFNQIQISKYSITDCFKMIKNYEIISLENPKDVQLFLSIFTDCKNNVKEIIEEPYLQLKRLMKENYDKSEEWFQQQSEQTKQMIRLYCDSHRPIITAR